MKRGAYKPSGAGYTMTCQDCRKPITIKGCCYDCARVRNPKLPERTIQPASFRLNNQSAPSKWGITHEV